MNLITRHISFSTVISVAVHAVFLFGFVAAADLDILPKIKPKISVVLKDDTSANVGAAPVGANKTPVGANKTPEALFVRDQPRDQPHNPPVMNSTAKTTYHMSRHFADERVLADYAHHSKRRVISASTHEARDESYLAYWRDVVEARGTEQYRADASVRERQGELRVLVAIAADGRLAEVKIRASSGDPALDNLAIHIVKSSAPFKPLPAEIAKDTDVLEIIRTWRFTHEGQLGTENL